MGKDYKKFASESQLKEIKNNITRARKYGVDYTVPSQAISNKKDVHKYIVNLNNKIERSIPKHYSNEIKKAKANGNKALVKSLTTRKLKKEIQIADFDRNKVKKAKKELELYKVQNDLVGKRKFGTKTDMVDKLKAKLDKAINSYNLKKDNNIKYNKYGVMYRQGEIREFNELKKEFNKNIKRQLKELRKNNRALYDYIHNSLPKGLLKDSNGIMEERMFSKTCKDTYKDFFNKHQFNHKLLLFKKFTEEGLSLTGHYENEKNRIFQIFRTNNYQNMSQATINFLDNAIESVSMTAFSVWYQNNKDKVQEWYDLGRLEDSRHTTVAELESVTNKVALTILDVQKEIDERYKEIEEEEKKEKALKRKEKRKKK